MDCESEMCVNVYFVSLYKLNFNVKFGLKLYKYLLCVKL